MAAFATAALPACGDEAAAPLSATSAELTASQTYLVSFKSGDIPSDAATVVAGAGGTIVTKYANVGLVLARGGAGFAAALAANARVDGVGASRAVSSLLTPRKPKGAPPPAVNRVKGADPLSNHQWDMDQIHAPQARAISAGKRSVLVGVLDSGVDRTHPDLVGQVDSSASASCVGGVANADPALWANDVIGHGTHVSGIIAGAKNGVGIVGVAPGVKVAAVKLAVDDVNDPSFGLVFADAMVCALDWAIGHGFDVMNASLSIDPFTGPIDDIFCSDQPDRAAVVAMVRKAVGATNAKKIPLVASTANFFTDLASLEGQTPGATCKVIPVQLPRVIGVSAVGYTRKLSSFSNYGFGAVDVTGPGGDNIVPDPLVTDTTASGQVLSSVPPDSLYYQWAAGWDGQVQDCSTGPCVTYAYIQGTSQAAPHVTGVSALAISRFGRMSPDALLALLSLTATPLPCPAGPYDPGMTGTPATCKGTTLYNNFYGAGEIDALAISR
ncbi:MAG TPA: S8 family serine peptidase [Polyangia bacterium]|nr:S8 family serine peptidase [Polyangia bacterium]